MEERLQKIIAQSGYTSRRKAEELITKGKVSVNGKVVRELGTKVKPSDEILVEGNIISNEPKEYYLLNKPRETISSASDDLGRKTIVDIIETNARIFPVGRLDYDTTGLILLTNDGDLTNILTHPNSRVPKTYLAKLDKVITMEHFFSIKNGLEIEGRKVGVSHIKIKKKDEKKGTCFVELTITEGRNHIIKKLFAKLGYGVTKLTRTHYAFLDLSSLLSGEYRTLTKREIVELYKYEEVGRHDRKNRKNGSSRSRNRLS